MENKSVDDMKLEVAIIVEKESILRATYIAREYFPFQAPDIKQAVIVVLAIYEEVNGKEYPNIERYRYLLDNKIQ